MPKLRSVLSTVANERGLGLCLSALLVCACASTQVEDLHQSARGEKLPRPDKVLVYDFQVTSTHVTLDHSVVPEAIGKLKDSEQNETEIELAQSLSHITSEVLVEELRKLGMQAEMAHGRPPAGNILLVHGQFLTVDQGSQTQRLVIGLGYGASEVRTAVQVYETVESQPRVLERFNTRTTSTLKPGMAETVGVGAVAGRAGVSAVVSTAVGAASEKWRDDVEADSRRTARKIAEQLSTLFLEQGWVTQEQVDRSKGVQIP